MKAHPPSHRPVRRGVENEIAEQTPF